MDTSIWNGVPIQMLKALEHAGHDVLTTGPVQARPSLSTRTKAKLYKLIFNQRYCAQFDTTFAQQLSSETERHITGQVDAVFCPGNMPWPVAFLDPAIPLVCWLDATIANLSRSYTWLDDICPESLKQAHQLQKQLLDRCELLIFSSSWAAESAISDYGSNRAKIHIMPFGPASQHHSDRDEVHRWIRARSSEICRLLFVGVEWQRKGGDTALEVAKRLDQMGVKVQLDIVGCNPKLTEPLPEFIKVHGFVDKYNSEGQQRMARLFSESHLLLLPTRAEAFGLVFAEASQYGLPSIATAVDGVPSVIRDGGKRASSSAGV